MAHFGTSRAYESGVTVPPVMRIAIAVLGALASVSVGLATARVVELQRSTVTMDARPSVSTTTTTSSTTIPPSGWQCAGQICVCYRQASRNGACT